MKRIFFFIQQDEDIGGTEMVSTNLVSHLCDYFDVTLFILYKGNTHSYNIDKKVHIKYLDYKKEDVKFDYFLKEYLKNHQYLKLIKLTLANLKNLLFKRFKTRKFIKSITTEEDILIASSMDNYLIMPRKRKVIFHYHFNAKFFFSFSESFLRLFCIKPSGYVFLTKQTYQEITKKKKFKYMTYIYNPCRFERIKTISSYHQKNNLIFAGRLMKQKDPMLLLKVALCLKNKSFDYVLNIFGQGPLYQKMEEFISNNNLKDNVILHGVVVDLKPYFLQSDLHIVTSEFEGFHLGIIEASALSTFSISTYWGDAVNEVIEENKNGLIVNTRDENIIADKIIEICNNKERLQKLKLSSYESSKRFDINKIIDEWVEFLNSL